MNNTCVEISLITEHKDPTIDEVLEFIELARKSGAIGSDVVSVQTERLRVEMQS